MFTKPRILVFDTFGTVVDWHGSIVQELKEQYPLVDANAFAAAWREQYHPMMQKVMSKTLPWTKLDDLHRLILNDIAPKMGLAHLSEEQMRHLNKVWHRLKPWPDALPGLVRLKSQFLIAPLSNGNISLLTHMAKQAGLPWDCILSTEIFQTYKPDPRAYIGVLDLFDTPAREVMMVAAHASDLEAARACGLQTAFIHRPDEWGINSSAKSPLHTEFDLTCHHLMDLADQLGCR